jgi:hypothetical protein
MREAAIREAASKPQVSATVSSVGTSECSSSAINPSIAVSAWISPRSVVSRSRGVAFSSTPVKRLK